MSQSKKTLRKRIQLKLSSFCSLNQSAASSKNQKIKFQCDTSRYSNSCPSVTISSISSSNAPIENFTPLQDFLMKNLLVFIPASEIWWSVDSKCSIKFDSSPNSTPNISLPSGLIFHIKVSTKRYTHVVKISTWTFFIVTVGYEFW